MLWDGSLKTWIAQASLNGTTSPLYLTDWDDGDVSDAIENARELVQQWDDWNALIRDVQTTYLLDLYNHTWRDDDAPEIGPDELLGRLSITSIECSDSGWRTVTYNQDDLFTDHVVEMRISPEGEVEAVLAG